MDDTAAEVLRILKSHQITADRLDAETKLDLAGMDSLLFLDVVLAFEAHFGVSFPSGMMVPESFETPLAIADAIDRLRSVSARLTNTPA